MPQIVCAPNFRDLGGMAAGGGARVRTGRLFRSEAIGNPLEDDAALLADLGIGLVCDLRSEGERTAAPNQFWLGAAVEILEMDITADIRAAGNPFDIMREDPGASGARALMISTYRLLPQACAAHLRLLFKRLDRGAPPLLLHCTAGKDRTGFMVAMLLHALGVSRDDISADYLRSARHRSPNVLGATREIMEAGLGHPVCDDAIEALAGVLPEYLDASLDIVVREYGSADAYLAHAAGLDAARRDRIRAALLV